MDLLTAAADDVGGDVISGGGTGTWDTNRSITELQAGSYLLMDTAYGQLGLPFRPALWLQGTVISVNRLGGWAVADVGLKALGMDHGNPSLAQPASAKVWFCSDEHLTFSVRPELPPVGERVRVLPAHVDPTVAYHEQLAVASPTARWSSLWPVDLRGW